MNRFFSIALLGGLVLAAQSSAHFVYFLPDAANATVRAVFSDNLKPDDQVAISKIENTKLFAIDAAGKESTPGWTLDRAGGFATVDLKEKDIQLVGGISDFGVLQRGDSKQFLLKYYPKSIVGDAASARVTSLGARVPVEIVPIVEKQKIRFQVLVRSKPASKTEVSVLAPGEEKFKDVITDHDGLSPDYASSGRYGVRTRFVEAKAGEEKGKKFEEIRHYATLVVDFGNGK